MTKKSLILMLVFGLASVSAAFTLDDFELAYNPAYSTLYVVGLVSDPGVTINAGIYDQTGPVPPTPTNLTALSDGSGGYAAGALWAIHAYSGSGWTGVDFTVLDSSPSTDPVDAMPWFSMTWETNVGDIFHIYDYDATTTLIGTTMILVPEPAMAALLALGGFLLRRRKYP